MSIRIFYYHFTHIPFPVNRWHNNSGTFFFDVFVINIYIIKDYRKSRAGMALVIFTKEYFNIIFNNTAKWGWVSPFPLFFKTQLVYVIIKAFLQVGRIQNGD